jgi:hypothetical protein
LELVGWLTVAANTHVARSDTAHRAFVVVQDFGCGKAWEDLYA